MIASRPHHGERAPIAASQAIAPVGQAGALLPQVDAIAFEQMISMAMQGGPAPLPIEPPPTPEALAPLPQEGDSGEAAQKRDEEETDGLAGPAETLLGVLATLDAFPAILPYGGRQERSAPRREADAGPSARATRAPHDCHAPHVSQSPPSLPASPSPPLSNAPPASNPPSRPYAVPVDALDALQAVVRHARPETAGMEASLAVSTRLTPAPIVELSMETHLPPSGSQPAYVQVAQRIEVALAPAPIHGPQRAPASGPPHILPGATHSPVQILRLQLQPVQLGQVDVELRLRDGAIEVRMVAETPEARMQLESGVDLLGAALREKGYDVQSLVVVSEPHLHRQSDQTARSGGEQARGQPDEQARGGFDQRDRNDRRDHARGRDDRPGDDRDGFAG